jgi:hypothetical protein
MGPVDPGRVQNPSAYISLLPSPASLIYRILGLLLLLLTVEEVKNHPALLNAHLVSEISRTPIELASYPPPFAWSSKPRRDEWNNMQDSCRAFVSGHRVPQRQP